MVKDSFYATNYGNVPARLIYQGVDLPSFFKICTVRDLNAPLQGYHMAHCSATNKHFYAKMG